MNLYDVCNDYSLEFNAEADTSIELKEIAQGIADASYSPYSITWRVAHNGDWLGFDDYDEVVFRIVINPT